MKNLKISLLLVFVTFLAAGYAQKPKKTFDSGEFAKKVKFYFVPEYVNSKAPDEAALNYIAEKTGKPLTEVKEQDKKDRDSLRADVAEFSTYGLIYTIEKVEEKIKQESPLKIADIIMYCAAGTSKFTIVLENCVQTNISWYLGDGASWEGEVFGDLDVKMSEKAEKDKIEKEKRDKERAERERGEFVADSMRVARPGYEATSYTFSYDESNDGMPMTGYYILNDGSKVEAVIAYQKPEFFVGDFAAGASLFICKELNSLKVNLLNPNNEPNFKEYIDKSKIRAFYINGHLYKNYENIGWRIVLTEGAIHSFITVVKIENKGVISYTSFKQTQRLNGTAYGSILSSITNENLLNMMSDAPEIVQSFRDGTRDIYQTEVAYNIWYNYMNLDAVHFVFGPDYGRAEFRAKYPDK